MKVLATAVLMAMGLCNAQCVTAQSVRTAPIRIAVASLGGDTVRIGAGSPTTVIAVFATWCRSCKDEVALFNTLQTEFAKRNVRVIALSGDETPNEHVQRWLDAYHVAYPVVRDTTGNAFRALGVVGVPEVHVISDNGQEIFVHRGPIASDLAALRSVVASASGHSQR